jgi:hypothetical protein
LAIGENNGVSLLISLGKGQLPEIQIRSTDDVNLESILAGILRWSNPYQLPCILEYGTHPDVEGTKKKNKKKVKTI